MEQHSYAAELQMANKDTFPVLKCSNNIVTSYKVEVFYVQFWLQLVF